MSTSPNEPIETPPLPDENPDQEQPVNPVHEEPALPDVHPDEPVSDPIEPSLQGSGIDERAHDNDETRPTPT